VGRRKIIKAALFPYDDEMYPYIKCASMLDGIRIQFLVSPQNWCVEGENVCGLAIQSELSEEDYDKIDALWICDSLGEVNVDNLLLLTRKALLKGKQVILTRKTDDDTRGKIEEMAQTLEGTVTSCASYSDTLEINNDYEYLEHITTPVISVSGPGENTDKFLTQLLLKEYLERNKCKVSLISSRVNSCLLKGVYSFPHFMAYRDMSAERKIILYNRMVKKIEKETNPDFLIIGIPGSILPAVNINARNFELGPYTVFKAVTPICSIMCLYGNYVTFDYLDELRQTMRYKYGTDVDFYYRSSSTVDISFLMGNNSRTISLINENMDESAYILEDISKIGDAILQKNKK
jgi:peptide maturation system protein (TIGR04066 family)